MTLVKRNSKERRSYAEISSMLTVEPKKVLRLFDMYDAIERNAIAGYVIGRTDEIDRGAFCYVPGQGFPDNSNACAIAKTYVEERMTQKAPGPDVLPSCRRDVGLGSVNGPSQLVSKAAVAVYRYQNSSREAPD